MKKCLADSFNLNWLSGLLDTCDEVMTTTAPSQCVPSLQK